MADDVLFGGDDEEDSKQDVLFGGDDEEDTSYETADTGDEETEETDESDDSVAEEQEEEEFDSEDLGPEEDPGDETPSTGSELEGLEDRLEDLEQKFEELAGGAGERLERLEEKWDIESLHSDMESLGEQLDDLRDLEESAPADPGLEKKVDELEEDFADRLGSLRERLESVEEHEEIESLKTEVEEVKDRLAEKSSLVKDLRSEIDSLKAEIGKLDAELRQVQASTDAAVDVKEELKRMKSIVSDFQWIFNDFDDLADLKLVSQQEFEELKSGGADDVLQQLNENLERLIGQGQARGNGELEPVLDELERHENEIHDIREGYQELGDMMKLMLQELRQTRKLTE